MKGQRVDMAFSNYDRFPKPGKFEREAIDFYHKHEFSISDLQELNFSNPRQFPAFSKQAARGDMWLRPELLKEVEAQKTEQIIKQQRL